MRKLLSAGWFRLRKDILFWIVVIGCAVSGVVFAAMNQRHFDDWWLIPVYVLLAAYLSLACGREYGDGTIRNKVICGHSRGQIYLSTLIVNLGACLMMVAAFLLTYVVLRLTVFPIHTVISAGDWLLCALNFTLGCMVFTTVFTMVAMLIPSRALSAIVSLAMVIILYFGCNMLENALHEPAMSEESWGGNLVELTEEQVQQVEDGTYPDSFETLHRNDGSVIYFTAEHHSEMKPNPHYLDEPLRTVAQVLISAIPEGQVRTYSDYLGGGIVHGWDPDFVPLLDEEDAARVRTFPLYSIGTAAVFTALGWLLYRKKELK